MPVSKRCERHMLHPSAPFTVGTPNCFCMACSASMTRSLSQRLCEHEDGRHAITDPCLHTFTVRSENLVSLALSGHPGIWHDESSDWRSCRTSRGLLCTSSTISLPPRQAAKSLKASRRTRHTQRCQLPLVIFTMFLLNTGRSSARIQGHKHLGSRKGEAHPLRVAPTQSVIGLSRSTTQASNRSRVTSVGCRILTVPSPRALPKLEVTVFSAGCPMERDGGGPSPEMEDQRLEPTGGDPTAPNPPPSGLVAPHG